MKNFEKIVKNNRFKLHEVDQEAQKTRKKLNKPKRNQNKRG